jgi:phosphoglycolate phosphatase-like HAD superfamily hydrolase
MTTATPSQDLTPGRSAFLFDLDGTLVDNVYEHVLAWREALAAVGGQLPAREVHRGIGMSGGLLAARRAGGLGIGLLSGGLAAEELQRACPYRIYDDPADLLRHIHQVGIRA